MSVLNWFHRLFYSLELLHSHHRKPRLYWFIYLITIIHIFLSLETDQQSLWISSLSKIASLQSILSQNAVFCYLMAMIVLQLAGIAALMYLAKNGNVRKSNFIDFLIGFLFWNSFINFTINCSVCDGFSNTVFKIISIVGFSLLFLVNLLLFNCTLNSKRTWLANQMLIVDILRFMLLWTNGQKVLLIMCLVLYLMASFGVIFFGPIFHLSSQNRFSQMIVSLTLSFLFISIVKLSVPSHESVTLLELTVLVLLTFLVFLAIQKWLQYRISKLYFKLDSVKKTQNQQNENGYELMEIVYLHFLNENFNQCQDKIKLVMLDHAARCRQSKGCNCKGVMQIFIRTKDQNQDELQNHDSSQQKSENLLIKSSEISPQMRKFKEEFSRFVLITLEKYLLEHENQSTIQKIVSNSLEKAKAGSRQVYIKKEVTRLQKSERLKDTIILHYIRLQKLMTSTTNLNSAYTSLKSLEFKLRSNKALSCQESGILTCLNQQIVEEKSVSMQTPNDHTNIFCVQYFNSQKVTNDLWELVVKTIEEIKTFWMEIKVQEPDESKILSTMSRIYKYHNRILGFYEEILGSEEKKSQQMVMIFKIYQELLELEGEFRFFGTNDLRYKQDERIKKIGSVNKKLYLSGIQTHTISFSIDQQNFGDIRYMSNGSKEILNSQCKNVKDFVPTEFEGSHQELIKNYLEKDHNYYRHSVSNPCYMKMGNGIMKPVYMENHLLNVLSRGQIQLAAFFKPLIDDFALLPKGICKGYGGAIEESVAICVNEHKKIVAWTHKFLQMTHSKVSHVQLEDFLSQNVIQKLKQGQTVQFEHQDQDYELTMIKQLPKSLISGEFYIIQCRNVFEVKNTLSRGQSRQNSEINPSQLEQLSIFDKMPASSTINTQIIQNIEADLNEVEKFDEVKKKINDIWDMASRPERHSFTKKWWFLSILFVVSLCMLISTTSIFLYYRMFDFIKLNELLQDFGQNQVSNAQAVTYLRQININLFTGQNQKIPMIPVIIEQVDRLKKVMNDKISKLGPYLGDTIWKSIQILPSGQTFVRQERAFMILNAYVLKSINNLVNNIKQDFNVMNFTVVGRDLKLPFTESQNNFVELISNSFSTVLPSLAQFRQNTINTFFSSVINDIADQPSFEVPMAGFGICVLFIIFLYIKNWRLLWLTRTTFRIFTKLNFQFSSKKIQQCQKRLNAFKQTQPAQSNKLTVSKKFAWRQLSRVMESQRIQSIDTDARSDIVKGDRINEIEKSSDFDIKETGSKNLCPPESNRYTSREETDRQLFKGLETSEKNLQNSCSEQNSNKQKNVTKQGEQQAKNIRFSGQLILNNRFGRKLVYLWLILPAMAYFSHIVMISLQFNNFMDQILMLQNKIFQRQETLTTAWNYQYELGLSQSPSSNISETIVQRVDQSYRNQKILDFYETETQKYIFGKLYNYKRASEIFSTGNVCQSLGLLSFHQPSFATNFTKDQCVSLADGILKKGTKQATVGILEQFRTLMTENRMPSTFSAARRMQYLKDSRIQTFNKIYSFMMASNQYILKEFQKDFDYFLRFYEIFIIIDGPLMILISIGMASVYLWKQYSQARRQMAIISCCFLVIGHGTFLRDPTLLEDDETKSPAERYQSLK